MIQIPYIMDFCILKKNKKSISIENIQLGNIVSLVVGKRTPDIDNREVYCRVDKLRTKLGTIYGIEVTHLKKYIIDEGYVFVIDSNQPIRNNDPKITKDCRKYGYNRKNFELYY